MKTLWANVHGIDIDVGAVGERTWCTITTEVCDEHVDGVVFGIKDKRKVKTYFTDYAGNLPELFREIADYIESVEKQVPEARGGATPHTLPASLKRLLRP